MSFFNDINHPNGREYNNGGSKTTTNDKDGKDIHNVNKQKEIVELNTTSGKDNNSKLPVINLNERINESNYEPSYNNKYKCIEEDDMVLNESTDVKDVESHRDNNEYLNIIQSDFEIYNHYNSNVQINNNKNSNKINFNDKHFDSDNKSDQIKIEFN